MTNSEQINKVVGIFAASGLKAGDTVCVQSSLKGFGFGEVTAEQVIEGLKEVTGPEGTIIMPAYNFHSWTEHHVFDIATTPSEVGTLSEVFRSHTGVGRTKHPIHSLSVYGSLRDELCAIDAINSFGDDSVFAILNRKNILYLTAGTGLAMPFLPCHYTEFVVGVGYRQEKLFTGMYTDEHGVSMEKRYGFDVKKEEFRSMISPVYEGHIELFNRGIVKQTEVHNTKVCWAEAGAYHEGFIQFIKGNPLLFRNL